MKTVSKKLLSLLLVAFLLVSALPFQAFAAELGTSETTEVIVEETPATVPETTPVTVPETTPVTVPETTPVGGSATAQGNGGAVVHDDALHTNFDPIWNAGTQTHSFKCAAPGCTYVKPDMEACVFNAGSHECKICHHVYAHNPVEIAPAVPATCTTYAVSAKYRCAICGEETGGEVDYATPLTGHNFDANGHCTNPGCTATQVTKEVKLYAGDGHAFSDGSTVKVFNLTVGKDIPNFPTPVDPNGEFVGWYIRGTNTRLDTTVAYDGTWMELEAKWNTTSYEVTFYRILNNQLSTATQLMKVNLTPDTNLARYVEDSGLLTSEKLSHPGYRLVINSQDYPVKKYVNGVFSPLSNTDVAKSLRTVYINLTPDTYTLSLNANGGTVNPSSISGIAYGTTVTLPTPTKVKSVFQGWKDTDGNIYKGSMVYRFTSNATLTAVWDSEATVMLRIFINGDFSAPDRIVELTGYISGSKVIRLTSDGSGTPDVTSIIQKYYVSSNGYALNVRGLFKEADWESFKANTSLSGDPIVTVDKNTTINVMVYNAAQNNGSSSGSNLPTTVPNNGNAYWVVTGKNTGYWVNTNGSASSLPTGAYWNGSYYIYDPYNYLSNSNTGSGSNSNLPTTVPNNGNAYWVITGNGTGYWVYTNGTTSALPAGAYWGGSYYIYNPNNIGGTNPTVPTYIYVGSNPKTGDTAKLEIAAAVMVLAAAGLILVMALRKKKSV